MAKFDLELESGYSQNPVKPITLSDGTVVKMEIVKNGEKRSISGGALKEDNEVATFRVNPDSNRLYMQVYPLDSVSQDVVAEIIEAFLEGVKFLLKV